MLDSSYNFLFKTRSETGQLLALCSSPSVDPEIFFNLQTISQAKAICETCPVKDLCLKESIINKEPFGVWGGVGEAERSRMIAALESNKRSPSNQTDTTIKQEGK